MKKKRLKYWIANPASKTVEVFSLENDNYKPLGIFNEKDGANYVKSHFFSEMNIFLKDIFF